MTEGRSHSFRHKISQPHLTEDIVSLITVAQQQQTMKSRPVSHVTSSRYVGTVHETSKQLH